MSKDDKAGIYKIINEVNGKFYIGSSVRLRRRKNEHFHELSLGKHSNTYLQNAYNKYGKDNFKWEIIEYIERIEDIEQFKKKILEREQYWIDKYKEEGYVLYNIRPTAESRLGVGYIKTDKGVLSSKEDWIPYHDMYLNGSTFRQLEKLLGICHKSIKKQFIYLNLKVYEEPYVWTPSGWLDKTNPEDWKPFYDKYIQGVSLRGLEPLLGFNKHVIGKIFKSFGFEIRDKNEDFKNTGSVKIEKESIKIKEDLLDLGYELIDKYEGKLNKDESVVRFWKKYNFRCLKCEEVFINDFNNGIESIKCPNCLRIKGNGRLISTNFGE